MAKLRTIIIDDEEPARERLSGLLKAYPDIEIIHCVLLTFANRV